MKATKKLLIFGAGHGGQELLKVVVEDINKVSNSWEVLGFIDNDPGKKGSEIFGCPVLGDKYDGDCKDVYGACAIMNNGIREKIINKEILAKGLKLASFIHPSVIMANDFIYQEGLIVYPGVKVSYDVKLGQGIMVNYNCVLGHGLEAGNYTYFGPSATIAGSCKIGHSCTIGAGSSMLQGTSVGNNSIVAIGTTLISNVGDNKRLINIPRNMETPK